MCLTIENYCPPPHDRIIREVIRCDQAPYCTDTGRSRTTERCPPCQGEYIRLLNSLYQDQNPYPYASHPSILPSPLPTPYLYRAPEQIEAERRGVERRGSRGLFQRATQAAGFSRTEHDVATREQQKQVGEWEKTNEKLARMLDRLDEHERTGSELEMDLKLAKDQLELAKYRDRTQVNYWRGQRERWMNELGSK